MGADFKSFIQKSYNYGYLTEEKEKELAQKMVQGDGRAREELIKCHLRMVFPLAKRFFKNGSIPLEDLIQEGNLGLVTAADNFDPTKNIRFAAYARWWIAEFIKRKFYKELYIVKTPLRVVRKSFTFQNKEGCLGKEKKKGENRAIINIVKKPYYLGDRLNRNGNNDDSDRKEMSWEHVLHDDRVQPEEKTECKDLNEYLESQFDSYLDENEKMVLRKRYFDSRTKYTYKNLGGKLNISSETVRNIEKRAIMKLRKKMKKDFSYS
jgi:RNA polymerase nonessential primary-like sigma factor